MIPFFRKIRKQLADDNKPLKYLRYAIGEIVLVVIGILIALQINNWNAYNNDRVIEKELLRELKENLLVNISNLQRDIDKEYASVYAIDLVVDHLDKQLAYNDSLDTYFKSAFYAPDIVLATSGFESIKSKGFDIISTKVLRKAVIDLFDVNYASMVSETVRLENFFWPTSVLPLFHKNFRLTAKDKAKPVNYEALLNNVEYVNMLLHRKYFREQAIALKKNALAATKNLIGLIDTQLN